MAACRSRSFARSKRSCHLSVADAACRTLATLPARWAVPVFPLKAVDFIARGVAKGPALGAALKAAEEAWIAAGFPEDNVALAAITDVAVRTK